MPEWHTNQGGIAAWGHAPFFHAQPLALPFGLKPWAEIIDISQQLDYTQRRHLSWLVDGFRSPILPTQSGVFSVFVTQNSGYYDKGISFTNEMLFANTGNPPTEKQQATFLDSAGSGTAFDSRRGIVYSQNDAPTLAVNQTATYQGGGGPILVAPALTLSPAGTIDRATVSINANFVASEDRPGIDGRSGRPGRRCDLFIHLSTAALAIG